jgi:hypothetical protein
MSSLEEVGELVVSAPENPWLAMDETTRGSFGCAPTIEEARAQAKKADWPYASLFYRHPDAT